MSTRLDHVLNGLKEKGRKGLIIYLTAGMPDAAGTIDAVRRAEEAGADVIELGLPFSDPMADGPVIQTASVAALKGGMTLVKVREIVQEIRRFSEMPLVGMGYVNNRSQNGCAHPSRLPPKRLRSEGRRSTSSRSMKAIPVILLPPSKRRRSISSPATSSRSCRCASSARRSRSRASTSIAACDRSIRRLTCSI